MRKTFFLLIFCAVAAAAAEPPETILSYAYPKEGKEAELEAAIKDDIAIMKKLDVIEPSPVLLLRGKDKKERPYFVMIFTWRSASIPDNAPPEIKKSWATMNALVETREQHRGIEFEEVTPLVVK